MRTKALIFDFDGLIVDSETPGYRAWTEVFEAHGCSLPFDTYSTCIGTINGFDLPAYLEQQTGLSLDRRQVIARCSRRWHELMNDQPLLPGIETTVKRARERGLKLAVASSSTKSWVTGNLEKRGLLGLFDVISTREDVAAVKPDPALYVRSLDKLGVTADQAIAFEDSPTGILAAKRAGIFCIFVPNELTRHLSCDHADRQLTSLEEFDLDDA